MCEDISNNIIAYSCQTDYCNAEELMAIADAMANNGMKELGYEYINVDGNQGGRGWAWQG